MSGPRNRAINDHERWCPDCQRVIAESNAADRVFVHYQPGLTWDDKRGGFVEIEPRLASPEPTPGLREAIDAMADSLNALDSALDDTHPEGDGCDICNVADELPVRWLAVVNGFAALAAPAPEPTGLDADEVRAAVEWGYRLGWQDRTKQGQGYAPTHRAAGYLAARLTGEGS